MLDPKYVADNLDTVRLALARRSSEAPRGLDAVAGIASRRKQLITETEHKQALRNAANQEMAKLAKGDPAAFAEHRERLKVLSEDVKHPPIG